MTDETKARLRRALARADADYCEIRVEESEQTAINLRGRESRVVTQETIAGANVRALKDGGWGFVSFNRLADLEQKVDEACRQAALLGSRLQREVTLHAVPVVEDEVGLVAVRDPATVPLRERVKLMDSYNELLLGQPEIGSTTMRYFDKKTHLTFANSEGSYITQQKLDLGLRLAPIASRGDLSPSTAVSRGSNADYGVALGLENELLTAAAQARAMLDAPVAKAGEYTVILDPEMAGVFVHEAFGHLSEADSVMEHEKLKELLAPGTRYGPGNLDIYDSGIEGPNRGEARYDDEGVPMQRTYLIKGGAVAGLLHSRETAAQMGAAPTGNARAISFRFPPIVRMRTTCIAPGPHSLADMLGDVELGVYLAGSYGGQTNGEMFTFTPVRMQMIRGGELAEPVRDANLTGNVFATLDGIDMIGSDFRIMNSTGGCGKRFQAPLATADGAPHIRIQRVVIGGDKS